MTPTATTPVVARDEVALPSGSASVPEGRRRLARLLVRLEVAPGLVDDALLIISELLTNAIEHGRPLARGVVTASWAVAQNRIEMAVTDGGSREEPTVGQPRLSDMHGRGLLLVQTLSSDWGVERRRGECTVWAVVAA